MQCDDVLQVIRVTRALRVYRVSPDQSVCVEYRAQRASLETPAALVPLETLATEACLESLDLKDLLVDWVQLDQVGLMDRLVSLDHRDHRDLKVNHTSIPVFCSMISHGYLSEARCRFAYGPAYATATHYLLLQ